MFHSLYFLDFALVFRADIVNRVLLIPLKVFASMLHSVALYVK